MRACVGELGDGLELAPSTVSHHLKELRRAGQHVECWANPDALERLAEFFNFAGGEAPPALAAIAATQDKTTG